MAGYAQLPFLFGIAGLGTFGHLLMYAAWQRGSVSFILPLDYLRIIWSTTIGIFIFADIPGLNLYIGGALIVGATSFITLRELKLKNSQTDLPLPDPLAEAKKSLLAGRLKSV